jgi:hypothetical protein
MPKISVITPVYCDTVEKTDWLLETIQSVRSQSTKDWEQILIDDKSPVHPAEARFKYADDPRIRWFDNAENSGPAKTRNTAVTLSESECIIALDSDDLFASPDVLEVMYDVWSQDKTKIIYGNLQMYTLGGNNTFQRGKTIELGQYTFELCMNLNGLLPVTAMHSKSCHNDSGGWKPELVEGLEDVEKWIMAGKRGYCGQKIDMVTLIYRNHEQSRAYNLKYKSRKFEAMQQQIKEMHSDIFSGRFPMACCGKGATVAPSSDPIRMSQQAAQQGMIIPLDGYDEKDLEWVLYDGPKVARSADVLIHGPAHLPQRYPIMGKGQIFQIHKQHHKYFEERQRSGFHMNQPDPRTREPEPEPVIVERPPEITEVPPPELSTILRLDSVAAKSHTADIQQMPEGFEPPKLEPIPSIIEIEEDHLPDSDQPDFAQAEQDYLDRMEKAEASRIDRETKFVLSQLELSPRIHELLANDNIRLWTVERLARAEPETLTGYSGIGIKTANTIIAKAQKLVGE